MLSRFLREKSKAFKAAARRAQSWLLHDRRWASLAGILVLTLPLGGGALQPTVEQPRQAHAIALGFTFSQRQAEYLTLPWTEVFDAALDLSPTVIRLGAYWDEIEPREGVYNWSTLDTQLDRAAERNLDVILTVGMKAPRWPEYFLPPWLARRLKIEDGATISDQQEIQQRTLAFVEQVVRRYRDHDAIAYWQIENEPLDPAGPHRWSIGQEFLAREIKLVRDLDSHPIIVTMFVEINPLLLTPWHQREVRSRAATILTMADVLGLDLYPNRGYRSSSGDWYFSWPAWMWTPTVIELQQMARNLGRPIWIMEAQAEPWEPGQLVYTGAPVSRSVNPARASAAVGALRAAGFDTILLWGVEHWYMRRELHQDVGWWNQMLRYFPLAASPDTSVEATAHPHAS
ncbi:MAG: beta-galactosidase [Chloroflexota bacterium]